MPDDKCPRILVVDDDADWREFLRLSLEDLGYCAVEASSGEQALEFMHRHKTENPIDSFILKLRGKG